MKDTIFSKPHPASKFSVVYHNSHYAGPMKISAHGYRISPMTQLLIFWLQWCRMDLLVCPVNLLSKKPHPNSYSLKWAAWSTFGILMMELFVLGLRVFFLCIVFSSWPGFYSSSVKLLLLVSLHHFLLDLCQSGRIFCFLSLALFSGPALGHILYHLTCP